MFACANSVTTSKVQNYIKDEPNLPVLDEITPDIKYTLNSFYRLYAHMVIGI